MNRVDRAWLFGGVTLIAIALGLAFFIQNPTVTTAVAQRYCIRFFQA
jgi:hypothetical protein